MLKQDALSILQSLLLGENLFALAKQHQVSVNKQGQINKGWVGQTLERIVRLPNSNAQKKDGEDFELKSSRLVLRKEWIPKETMKVTMVNPKKILEETFETSALWDKLSSFIWVGYHQPSPDLCQVVKVKAVTLSHPKMVQNLRIFWEDIRSLIASGEFSEMYDIGRSDDWIQLRPTGNGKYFSTCPITSEKFPARSFYLTKKFISNVLLNGDGD